MTHNLRIGTVVVPVRHEEGNVGPLLQRLSETFSGEQLEVIFVDDSDNHLTGKAIADHLNNGWSASHASPAASRTRTRRTEHLLVRHIHRTGSERWGGLSGAVIDGIREATGDVVLVMDGDGQHPPETAPQLIQRVRAGSDIVVASRYVEGGSSDGLDGFGRRLVSRVATFVTRLLFPRGLRGISDPMTGFFAFQRNTIDMERLADVRGYKILFELLTAHPDTKRAEVPLQFQPRIDGESKAGEGNGLTFIRQLLRLRLQSLPTFVNFAMGGGLIALVGMLMLAGFIALGIEPHVANGIQLVATLVLNFLYNRHITWKGKKGSRLHWQMMKFGLTRTATMVLCWLGFVGLMDLGARFDVFSLGWRAQLANGITLVGGMAINYFSSKHIVFNEQRTAQRITHRLAVWMASSAIFVGGGMLAVGVFGLQAVVIAFILIYAAFGAVSSALELRWRLYGRRTPEAQEAMKFRRPGPQTNTMRFHSFIVPALNEPVVIGRTLRRLLEQGYPHFEIVVTLADGDHATIEAVRAVQQEPGGDKIVIVCKHYEKSSKPQQLNYALDFCQGDYVTVVDAETVVHPRFLELANATIDETRADVVQGGVQLMNMAVPKPSYSRYANLPGFVRAFMKASAYTWWTMRSWFCVHNSMEYYFWFASRMFYQVDQGFVPLGGNTLAIRRNLLMEAGGWPLNLTEDCALGVKLTTIFDAKVVACYEPEFASREETPSHIFGKGGLVKQRTRWDQGFWSVLVAGEWLKLPTFRQRAMAFYILAMPLIQAINGIMLPLALVGVLFLTAPAPLVLAMFLPLLPMSIAIAIQVVGLRDFSREFQQKVTLRHYASLVLLNLPYQTLLALPAMISIWRHYRGRTNWEVTAKAGEHMIAMQTGKKELATTAS